MEFAYNNSYHSSIEMAPFEALYDRKCRTLVCWDEVGERKLLGPEYVQITAEKVKIIKKLKTAQDRQKNYADRRRRNLEFDIGDRVFLQLSLWKGVIKFGKRDLSHVLESQPVELKKNLIYEEEPVQILDRKEQVLRSKTIPLVKVLWMNHAIEEVTWESEEQMRSQYPQIFRT
ncbi:uncharacterized protein LOC111391110 [Olea europaea var. sylvestris]|uniref:uncharacterized protein LOC111391110 n=1 Tax=Olea europaea var. sylvestris TaxID=158386 RepID=UPI000C1CEDF9|nr:uncharacterized protein LOC111391110 [Olea europaea var. sylvestris]